MIAILGNGEQELRLSSKDVYTHIVGEKRGIRVEAIHGDEFEIWLTEKGKDPFLLTKVSAPK